ncbi:gag-pol polyprotein, partial [Trifolium medium]|nr:gag-pol polyprotein [Trifolium medium]
MDPKSDESLFMGYSQNSRTYRVFNSRTKTMTESINVVIDDSASEKATNEETNVIASDQPLDTSLDFDSKHEESNFEKDNVPTNKGHSVRVQKNHPKEFIIGDPDQGITTRRSNE